MPLSKNASTRSPPRLRILIADHHAVVRSALRLLLEMKGGFEIVAEASDGEAALEAVAQMRPDVALVDVAMPRMDGIEVTKHIRVRYPLTRVLALTAIEDESYVRAALAAGASGYVPKAANAAEVMEAIRIVAGGKNYVHPRVALARGVAPVGAPCNPLHDLTPREMEVIRLIAYGYVHKEVAARLNVSVKTVETHKGRAMQKLGVSSRVDIVRLAAQHGWISGKEESDPVVGREVR
jgi:DNA-binding NarL/FixJ family response regulator